MPVIHGLRHERAGQHHYAAVAGVVWVASLGFGRLEFPVLPGNGKPGYEAVIVGDDFESRHFHDHFATFHLHLMDRVWQPADITGLSVLRHQRPIGDALADRNLDLRMKSGPALIEATGVSHVLVAGLLEVEEGLEMDLTNVGPFVRERLKVVIQVLWFPLGFLRHEAKRVALDLFRGC